MMNYYEMQYYNRAVEMEMERREAELMEILKKEEEEYEKNEKVWGESEGDHGPEIFDVMKVCLREGMQLKFQSLGTNSSRLLRETIKKHNLNISIGFLEEFDEHPKKPQPAGAEFDMRMRACFKNIREIRDDGSFIADLYINENRVFNLKEFVAKINKYEITVKRALYFESEKAKEKKGKPFTDDEMVFITADKVRALYFKAVFSREIRDPENPVFETTVKVLG